MVESENLRRSQQQILIENKQLINDTPTSTNGSTSNTIKLDNPATSTTRIASNLNKSAHKPKTKRKKTLSKEAQTKKSLKLNTTKSKRSNRQRKKSFSHEIAHNSASLVQCSNDNTASTSSNSSVYLNDAAKIRLINDPLTFSQNALFHSASSLLTKLDLKALFQPSLFESLPRQSQLKLIKLLPECDRQLDSHGSFKLSLGALNNEFIKKCCIEWQHKLGNSEFGNYNINNSHHNSNNNNVNNQNYNCYESTILHTSTTITRSTRLKQQKILQNLIPPDHKESSDDEFFYYDEEDSLDRLINSKDDAATTSTINNIPDTNLDNSKTSTSIVNRRDFKLIHKIDTENNQKLENYEEDEEEEIFNETGSVYGSATSSSPLNSSLTNQFESSSRSNSEFQTTLPTPNHHFSSENEDDYSSSFSSSSSSSSSFCCSDDYSLNNTKLDEENDLEAKKLQIQRKAKRLLKKNKKLRRNFALTADCMIASITKTTTESPAQDQEITSKSLFKSDNKNDDTSSSSSSTSSTTSSAYLNLSHSSSTSFTNEPQQTTLRKSQRKRQTNKKFAEDEYALEDDGGDYNFDSKLNLKLKGHLKVVKSENIVLELDDESSATTAATLVVMPGKSSTLESEKKGELKLRIKRVLAPSNNLNLQSDQSHEISKIELMDNNNSDCLGESANSSFEDKFRTATKRKRNFSETQSSSECNDTPISTTISSTSTAINNLGLKALNNSNTNSNMKHLELVVSVSDGSSLSQLSNPISLSPSQSTPLTRAALAKLKQQISPLTTIIDVKPFAPPAPPPLSAALSKILFNDDNKSNEEETNSSDYTGLSIAKKMLLSPIKTNSSRLDGLEDDPISSINIPTNNKAKTLAQIKLQIAEIKKRKFTTADIEQDLTQKRDDVSDDREQLPKRLKTEIHTKNDSQSQPSKGIIDSYNLNIEKIVHELKLIGNNNGTAQESDSTDPTKSLANKCEHFEPKPTAVLTNNLNINLSSLINQHHQQQIQSLVVNTVNFLPIVDTSILENGFLSSIYQELDDIDSYKKNESLPSINSLLLIMENKASTFTNDSANIENSLHHQHQMQAKRQDHHHHHHNHHNHQLHKQQQQQHQQNHYQIQPHAHLNSSSMDPGINPNNQYNNSSIRPNPMMPQAASNVVNQNNFARNNSNPGLVYNNNSNMNTFKQNNNFNQYPQNSSSNNNPNFVSPILQQQQQRQNSMPNGLQNHQNYMFQQHQHQQQQPHNSQYQQYNMNHSRSSSNQNFPQQNSLMLTSPVSQMNSSNDISPNQHRQQHHPQNNNNDTININTPSSTTAASAGGASPMQVNLKQQQITNNASNQQFIPHSTSSQTFNNNSNVSSTLPSPNHFTYPRQQQNMTHMHQVQSSSSLSPTIPSLNFQNNNNTSIDNNNINDKNSVNQNMFNQYNASPQQQQYQSQNFTASNKQFQNQNISPLPPPPPPSTPQLSYQTQAPPYKQQFTPIINPQQMPQQQQHQPQNPNLINQSNQQSIQKLNTNILHQQQQQIINNQNILPNVNTNPNSNIHKNTFNPLISPNQQMQSIHPTQQTNQHPISSNTPKTMQAPSSQQFSPNSTIIQQPPNNSIVSNSSAISPNCPQQPASTTTKTTKRSSSNKDKEKEKDKEKDSKQIQSHTAASKTTHYPMTSPNNNSTSSQPTPTTTTLQNQNVSLSLTATAATPNNYNTNSQSQPNNSSNSLLNTNNNNNKAQRSTQHQLTVAQLLSQKHHQQQKQQQQQQSQPEPSREVKSTELNTNTESTEPLTKNNNNTSGLQIHKAQTQPIQTTTTTVIVNKSPINIPNLDSSLAIANTNNNNNGQKIIKLTMQQASGSSSPSNSSSSSSSSGSMFQSTSPTNQFVSTTKSSGSTSPSFTNINIPSTSSSSFKINKSASPVCGGPPQIIVRNVSFSNTLIKKLSPPPPPPPLSPQAPMSSNSATLFEPINLPKEAEFSDLTKSASPTPCQIMESTEPTENLNETNQTTGISFKETSVDHTCQANSSRAMIECEKCGCFSHADCVFIKKFNNTDNSIKVCSDCFPKLNQSFSTTSNENNVNSNSYDNDDNTNGSNANNAL